MYDFPTMSHFSFRSSNILQIYSDMGKFAALGLQIQVY